MTQILNRVIGAGTTGISPTDLILDIDSTLGEVIVLLPATSVYRETNLKIGTNNNFFGFNYRFNNIAGSSPVTIMVGDASDNINGGSSVILPKGAKGTIMLSEESGWNIVISGSASSSVGTFNTVGLGGNIFYEFSDENLPNYSLISIQGAGKGVKIDGASGIYYFQSDVTQQIAINGSIVDVTTFNFQNNKKLQVFNQLTGASSTPPHGTITTLNMTNNLLQTSMSVNGFGGGTNPLANVVIVNCPLLELVSFGSCSLTVASVDGILAYLDSTGVTGGQVALSGGVSAPPTGGAGNPNVVSLLGKGWLVVTN